MRSLCVTVIHSLLLCGTVFVIFGHDCVGAQDVDFNRDIRPILSNHCFQCHGPDDDSRQAELRLDQRAAAVAGDGEQSSGVIVPGDARASALFQRVTSSDSDLQMPPPEFGKALTETQISHLREWIDGGAEYAGHWSFEPIRRPDLPAVADEQPGVVRNEIDNFILSKLAEHSIEPSPPADRYTLIRRVYLDLLGLPPTVEQVQAFVNDKQDGAYERLLDSVLASPHFGERWGRHWLDQARYADSHGYTIDGDRVMWPYRDWVIDAFNRDLPFDQFTIEQLAGDLLPNASLSQQVATGFHRNTLINQEGGTKADQFRDEQVKDRVDTTGVVWMGLTVGCAKCHTHKYDPITQHEYYQLYAFFNSTADNNSASPTVPVPTTQQTQLIEQLTAEHKTLKQQLAEHPGRAERRAAWEMALLNAAVASARSGSPDPKFTVLALSGMSTAGAELQAQQDHSVLVSGPSGAPGEFEMTTGNFEGTIRAVQLEVLTHPSLPKQGPGRAGNGNFVLTEFTMTVRDEARDGSAVEFESAAAEHSQPNFPIDHAIDGKGDTGWAINGAPEGSLNRDRKAWFALSQPVVVKSGNRLTFVMKFHSAKYDIGRFRIGVSDTKRINDSEQAKLWEFVQIPVDKRSKEQQQALTEAFVRQDPQLAELNSSLTEVNERLTAARKGVATTMVLRELQEPRPAYLHVRGDFLQTGDEVQTAVPAVLPALEVSDAGANRLDLARWLTSAEHPLTARVRVNRIWMRLFGRGIVETENDFGIQASLPTHPRLLDWLADEFRRQGWSQKALIRTIMNSATYRQSSAARPDLATIDARNLLLAKQSRLRVEAEIVRDIALTASGRLAKKVGGPSVYPPQEAGIYDFTQSKKNWKTDQAEDRYRRGMYTYFYRSAPYPMLATFDVPKFNTTCTQRDRSNTPLQSLTIANSEAMFELAQHFADRILQSVATSSEPAMLDQQRLEFAFRVSFSRPPSASEMGAMNEYLVASRERFSDERLTWTAVARLLMNLDEFITRE